MNSAAERPVKFPQRGFTYRKCVHSDILKMIEKGAKKRPLSSGSLLGAHGRHRHGTVCCPAFRPVTTFGSDSVRLGSTILVWFLLLSFVMISSPFLKV